MFIDDSKFSVIVNQGINESQNKNNDADTPSIQNEPTKQKKENNQNENISNMKEFLLIHFFPIHAWLYYF